MKVSIILLTWLYKPELMNMTIRCVASIRNCCKDFELIIIDNGSPIQYHEKLKELSDKIIFNTENLGFSKGVNQGVAIADGEFILLLNNDTVTYEDICTRLVKAWDDKYGAIGALKKNEFRVNSWEYIEGWCFFTSQRRWEDIGPLDEQFSPAYGEDADWCFRASQAGYTLLQLKLNIRHLRSQTANGTEIRSKFFYYNVKKLVLKWRPTNIKVGVVIPCHNYGRYLNESIQSVLNQTYPVHRIIVVDDASDEDISSIVKKYPTVEFYRVDYKFANKARNFGLRKLGDCNYLLLLDADNYLDETYLDRMLDYMTNVNKSASYMYCDRFIINEDSKVTGEEHFQEFNFNELKKVNFIDFASLMKRGVYDFQLGLDEDPMFDALEDWDFWIGAAFKGFVGHHIPEKLIYYRNHPTNKSNALRKDTDRYLRIKNKILNKYHI